VLQSVDAIHSKPHLGIDCMRRPVRRRLRSLPESLRSAPTIPIQLSQLRFRLVGGISWDRPPRVNRTVGPGSLVWALVPPPDSHMSVRTTGNIRWHITCLARSWKRSRARMGMQASVPTSIWLAIPTAPRFVFGVEVHFTLGRSTDTGSASTRAPDWYG